MLGIEKLKVVAKVAIQFAHKLEKALKDDKISVWEGLGLIPNLKDITFIVQNRTGILEEFKDLDENEKLEIALFIKQELDLENDKLEMLIEKAVMFAASVGDLVNSFRIFATTDPGQGPTDPDPDK